ncbi:hypothetical protein RRG08_039708 [Elysia crispata]|uniref:Uncharacterized protein n=1 Tax=Elysia crispata TaxID=231223 RepID=A0AAE0Y9Z2_9GAST|nr:hypothetical protein RRG08_039708 [Elysia crispata]
MQCGKEELTVTNHFWCSRVKNLEGSQYTGGGQTGRPGVGAVALAGSPRHGPGVNKPGKINTEWHCASPSRAPEPRGESARKYFTQVTNFAPQCWAHITGVANRRRQSFQAVAGWSNRSVGRGESRVGKPGS